MDNIRTNVKDFVVVGDGEFMNTDAIQKWRDPKEVFQVSNHTPND